jgi:hypothetical protein
VRRVGHAEQFVLFLVVRQSPRAERLCRWRVPAGWAFHSAVGALYVCRWRALLCGSRTDPFCVLFGAQVFCWAVACSGALHGGTEEAVCAAGASEEW